ncbi:ankyrin repeat-containing protein ITN1-like [Solanum stenotomum]|uniref:ankyrin repeat-containing protein ITN1-like n=1 Tax=Solanum stenotomum TaxID=172797 RepID=UPI0020D00975|nr:ankyrin repeat-containing protein ITN1-like [Solanum stenotomum]
MDTEKRLYEAAVKGDVRVLQELLQQDALILDRLTLTCFNETPLHIAALRGHIEFVRLILAQNPQLAAELDWRKSSALHIASAKGHLHIVKMLLLVNPELCLVCDRDGGNPLHLAAIKGRVEVIKELIHMVRMRCAVARGDVHEPAYRAPTGGNEIEIDLEVRDELQHHLKLVGLGPAQQSPKPAKARGLQINSQCTAPSNTWRHAEGPHVSPRLLTRIKRFN